jgi:hypothetical protein
MASEKQIAANKRNASKSRGPASVSGKRRSSQNALSHGLSRPDPTRSEARFRELVRGYAGGVPGDDIRVLAERAADAHLNLERVRNVQLALLNGAGPRARNHRNDLSSRNVEQPGGAGWERLTERAAPDLERLFTTTRYEKREIARRARAVHDILAMKLEKTKSVRQEL